MKQLIETLRLEKIVGGGQALGQIADGRKAFVWGGLPGELVKIRLTKRKSHFVEGVVTEVIEPSPERITPRDPDSYLNTSPWQIMPPDAEQQYKTQLISDAFLLHDVALPSAIDVYCDNVAYGYRNKVEFSWYSDTDATTDADTLDLAFFRRGSKGKVVVDGTSLARPEINGLARAVRDLLHRKSVSARQLKTLLIRCNQRGNCAWQLYVKDRLPDIITTDEATNLPAQGGEIIYSDPRSPASRITERLSRFGDTTLIDTILGTPFRYACEGFFQVNIPVYEQALRDMREWAPCNNGNNRQQVISQKKQTIYQHDSSNSFSEGFAFPAKAHKERQLDQLAARRPEEKDVCETGSQSTLDLYAGVGTISLTIGGDNVTLVEINEHATAEMQRNITELNRANARAVLAPSEQALDYITGKEIVIVDPPRAGLHTDVIATLLQKLPPRIIYLSCNPVTQARDTQLLQEKYHIVHHRGYNFFPRTPHIEHLIIFDRK
ncbi:MAG: RsmD family RNA methyltransferase [Candidatus Nanogingivalaceae bacterium]|nr:RsmD family RNA methyltransferase [Candidatus Nanogingivalaceae bacterium]